MYKVIGIIIFFFKFLNFLRDYNDLFQSVSFLKRSKSTPRTRADLEGYGPLFSTTLKQSAFKKHTLLMIRHQLNEALYYAVQDSEHFETS